MAVSENDLVVGPLTPAAGVKTISLDFYFEQAAWLEVYKSGSETPLVLNTDYTVTGAGSNSGVVTLTTAASGTDAYSVYLVVPLQRSSDMQLRGEFKSDPFNVEMDRIWQRLQHHFTLINKKFGVGRNDGNPAILNPSGDTQILGFGPLGAYLFTPENSRLIGLTDSGALASFPYNIYAETGAQIIYQTPTAMLAASEASRGVDAIWRAGRHLYLEVASGGDLTTAGGVELDVLPDGDGAYHTDAWGISPGVDETTKFYAALAKAANGTLVINFNVAAYIGDRLIPAANTTIKFEPGTVYKAKTGGTRAIQIQQENVHVWGYGARVELNGSQNSHAVLISGGGSNIAKNCSVRGLHAKGSGNSGDDCFYIGGDVATGAIPENIQIIDCKGEGLGAGTRNCVSVVACDGYLIEGCEFWNATGSPGAGIDLEANLYKTDGTSAIRRGVIRRNKVHSCDSGIVSVFGDDCIIEDNEVYGNAGDGIGSAAGGTQFDDAIYRTGDRLGVISFAADGWITVEDTNLLTDDLGIEVGTVVARRTESGASWPSAFSTTYYIVNEISADQFSFKISTDFDYGTITSVTGSGTGTLDKDPTVSDMHFYVYRAGNNSNMTIRRNTVFGNGSANSQIKLSQMVNVIIDSNIVTASTTTAIGVTYSQNVRAEKNRCQPAVLSTSVGRGINIGVCSEVSTRKNRIYGFGGEGLNLSGSQVESDGDMVLNCGHSGNRATRFQRGTGMLIRGIVVRNDLVYPSNSGLVLENTVTDSLVVGARCKDAGADNASSLVIGGTNVRAMDCMVNDGTFYGELEKTWNAPSIADGASNTTPHTFTGTRPGDFVIATLENNTAGLSVSASAYTGGVRVTITNNTGSAVDLAETTLRLKRLPRQ